jgi:hypothetical protein
MGLFVRLRKKLPTDLTIETKNGIRL